MNMQKNDKPRMGKIPFNPPILEEIEKLVKKEFEDRKPDVIIDESDTLFMVTLSTNSTSLNGNTQSYEIRTGIGGLKEYLLLFDKYSELVKTLKVQYNGVILNDKEKDKLLKKVLEYGT